MVRALIAFGIAGTMFLGACGKGSENAGADAGKGDTASTATGGSTTGGTAAPAGSDAGAVKTYTFHGTVTKVDSERQMITIDHEQIGDYMEAMTMPFKVADPALLGQVKVGQESHFTLRVSGDEALLVKIADEHAPGTEH